MRILIIPTTDWLRHPTPHRHHYLAEKLSKRHEVYVLHFDIFEGEERWKTSVKLIKTGPIHTQKLVTYYLINAPFHRRTIKKVLKDKDIDVIWAAHLLPSLLGFRASMGMRKNAKILNVYDFNDYFPEGAAMYYDNKAIKSLLYKGGTMLLHKNMKIADLVTATSPSMYEYAKNNGAKRVELLTNGVDTELFYPDMDVSELYAQLKIDNPVIGLVATVERWFKLEEIIHAFKEISEKNPKVQFLIIGGSIKTSYYNELVKLVNDLNLNGKTIMTGIVPYHKVPMYINLMDIAIIPSIKEDAKMKEFYLPNKLFQYLACGKTVLTSPFAEIIKVAENAVIPFYNNNDLCHKCVELLSSGVSKNLAGIEIAKNYDWEIKAQRLEKLFEEYLDIIS
jgi:glycosyltransferase involved in cell wall biosynthesis